MNIGKVPQALILCVASEDDFASKSIAGKIIDGYNLERLPELSRNSPVYLKILDGRELRLIVIKGELVFEEHIADSFKPDLIIFVSRHESKSGRPILSIHTPGNIGDAEFGGVARKISIAPANTMRNILLEMLIQKDRMGLKRFEVYYEGTHHGPSLDFPSIFVEIGSTLAEWKNLDAAEAVARAVIEGIKSSSTVPVALGMGGSHCNRRFTKLATECDVAFGHIIPSYLFHSLDNEILRQCIERTLEEVQMVVLDWKGIDGKDREGLLDKLKYVPLEIKRVSDFKRGL